MLASYFVSKPLTPHPLPDSSSEARQSEGRGRGSSCCDTLRTSRLTQAPTHEVAGIGRNLDRDLEEKTTHVSQRPSFARRSGLREGGSAASQSSTRGRGDGMGRRGDAVTRRRGAEEYREGAKSVGSEKSSQRRWG